MFCEGGVVVEKDEEGTALFPGVFYRAVHGSWSGRRVGAGTVQNPVGHVESGQKVSQNLARWVGLGRVGSGRVG